MTTTTQRDTPMHFTAWKAAFDAAPDAMLILDGDDVLYANRRAVDIMGRSNAELGGAKIASFVDQPQQGRSILRRADGSTILVDISTGTFSDNLQTLTIVTIRPSKVTAIGVPVSSLESLQAIFEGAPGAIFLSSSTGLKYRNQAAAQLTGYSIKQLMGLRLSELIADQRLGSRLTRGVSSTEAAPKETYQGTLRRKDRALVPVVITTHSVRISGMIVHIGTVMDATSTKAFERTISESNQLLNAMFDQPAVAMAVSDPNLRFLRANDAMTSLTGYTNDELLFMTPNELHDDERMNHVLSRMVVPGASPEVLLVDVITKDGDRVPCEYHVSGFPVAGGWRIFWIAFDIRERIAAQRSLTESERRFRSMFESAPIGLALGDRYNRNIMVNPAMREIFGRDAAELESQVFAESLPPEYAEARQHRHDSMVRGAINQYSFETPYLRPDGTIVWATGFSAAVRDQAGEFLYSVQSFQDVSERVEREETLRLSEQRYAALSSQMQSILESAGEGIYVSDTEGRLILSNRSALDMSGLDIAEVIGHDASNFADLHTIGGELYQMPTTQAVIRGGRPIETPTLEIKRPDGSSIAAEITVAAVRAVDGSPQGTVGIIRDVTARISAENALDASFQRFRALFEKSPIGIAVVNGRGEMEEVNQALREMLGRDDSELLGKGIRSFVAQQVRARQFERLVAGDLDSFQSERRLITADGSTRWGQITTFAVRNERSGFLYALRLVEDITGRKQAEAALRESETRFRMLFESVPVGVALLGMDGVVQEANPSLAHTLGRERSDLVGARFSEWMPPNTVVRSARKRFAESDLAYIEDDRAFRRPDGSVIEGYQRTFAVRDSRGTAVSMVRTVEDVTEQRAAQQQIHEDARVLQTIVDRLPMAVFLQDENMRFTLVNETAARMTGFSAEELLAMHAWELVPEEEQQVYYMKSVIPLPDDYPDADNDVTLSRKDGTTIPVSLSTRNVGLESPGHRLSIWRDLSRQRLAQRNLARQIAGNAESEERERLARDIHDTVVQDLTGIVLQLELAQRLFIGKRRGFERQLGAAKQFAREALANTRRSVWDLSTATLAPGELPIALKNEIKEVLSGRPIMVTVNTVGEEHPLSRRVETAFLRIAHEAATNVAKHAGASEVLVSLEYGAAGVSMRFSDNGRGLAGAQTTGGFGIRSMHERAKLIGAVLEIRDGSPAGTIVDLRVDLVDDR